MAEEESVYCGLTASRVNVPLMSCCKRVKAAAEDRLSALPDTLLHQILFSLGTKEVIMTCVLSKRWQFLWTDSSKFELIEHSRDIAKIGRFVNWVGRALLMCGGTHLQTLIVRFWYQHCFASNINLWVQFVVKNKIKVFGLFFLSNDDLYVLPQMLYSDSALTTLALGPCSISPNVGIDWRFLKSLLFFYVKLEDSVFQKILVGCPVLEVLTLNYCWGLDHMKIYAQNLNELVIDSWRHAESNHCLVITAPYLHTVKVIDAIITRVVVVGHFPFLVTAKVDYRFRNDTFAQVDSMILPNVKRSLESFRDVKELELGPWCIEVLSRLEERGLNLSPSTRLCLTLTAWRHKRSIAGILHVLKSSPNLETLVIKGTSLEPNLIYESHNEAAAYLREDGLDLVLPNLKTIELSGLSKAGLSGEPMLTLVRLLLKSAANLEKMVIDAKRMSGYTLTTCYSTEFTEISLKLLSFPRSSTKAVVMVR